MAGTDAQRPQIHAELGAMMRDVIQDERPGASQRGRVKRTWPLI
jgi:hypothetical protein